MKKDKGMEKFSFIALFPWKLNKGYGFSRNSC